MKSWESENSGLYALIFSYYLELVWLEELVRMVAEMTLIGDLSIPPIKEKNFVNAVINGKIINPFGINNVKTFFDLVDSIRNCRKYIEDASLYGGSIKETYLVLGNVGQIGSLGASFCSHLSELVGANKEGGRYKFKICLDECECLSDMQVVVINTLIRLSRFPVLYVFSFVRKPKDFTTTFIDNITNQKADFQLIDLDEMQNFKDFAEGVATVRIRAAIGSPDVRFSLKKVFGQLSINHLLEDILSKSVSSNVRTLLARAKSNKEQPFFEFYRNEGLPIYQTYLANKLNINIENSIHEKWRKRAQESKEIRKKMVVAYLAICNETGHEPIYGYSDMIVGLCDKSIRDFLWQLDEIFNTYGGDIESFHTSSIPINIQNIGIKKSSEKKFHSIPQAPVTSPGGVGRLVYGLASLTSIIQTTSNDFSHLRSSERGRFYLKITASKRDQQVLELITQGADAGFLRILEKSNELIRFRVHTSLAPAFKFSYRGAYYDTKIEGAQLERLLHSQDKNELDKIIQDIAASLYDVGERKQLSIEGFFDT